MRDVNLAVALQKGMRTALLADGPLAAALSDQGVTNRVYDRVPEKSAFPYLTIGDDDIKSDGNMLSEGVEVFAAVHVWSRALGRIEAKRLGGMARRALDTEILIEGNLNVAGEFLTEVYRDGRDALETEGVLAFRYLIDPAA
jgi:hypothetical protein